MIKDNANKKPAASTAGFLFKIRSSTAELL